MQLQLYFLIVKLSFLIKADLGAHGQGDRSFENIIWFLEIFVFNFFLGSPFSRPILRPLQLFKLAKEQFLLYRGMMPPSYDARRERLRFFSIGKRLIEKHPEDRPYRIPKLPWR